MGTYQPFCQVNIPKATPFELLAYVRDADYVITDTFHGCVKKEKNNSLINRKKWEAIQYLEKQTLDL